MFDDAFASQTDAALGYLARNPAPPKPPTVSGWAALGQTLVAPLTGAGQAVNESLRAAARAADAVNERLYPGFSRNEQVQSRDEALRSGAEYWKPDPITTHGAANFVHQASRAVTKVAAYTVATRNPLAAAGAFGADEGMTGFVELTDQGVDPSTAAKVGAVRGTTAAISAALPVAGRTIPQTVGLVAVSGPGTFVAEQAATREILEAANYTDLARQYDPTDLTGLALSLAVPSAVAIGVHAVRARKPAAAALADQPEVLDAAHVAYGEQTRAEATLGNPSSVADAQAHAKAMAKAAEQLEAGRAVDVMDVAPIDPQRATAALQQVRSRLDEALLEPTPQTLDGAPVDPLLRAADEPVRMASERGETEVSNLAAGSFPERPADAAPVPALQRAEQIARDNPDLPVPMSDAPGDTVRAADFLETVKRDAQRDRTEARAFAAAVECALRFGG